MELFDKSTSTTRQERIFVFLAGLFFSTLVTANLLGMSRFIDFSISLGPWTLPILLPFGILPYPLTILCNDLIAEFYGRSRANLIILIGLFLNLWIVFLLWGGSHLPPTVELDAFSQLPPYNHPDYVFFRIRAMATASIVGSTLAYLTSQFLDVYLFQLLKRLTAGKHLWLRYNLSAWVSQLVDTFIVITISLWLSDTLTNEGKNIITTWGTLVLSCYCFKIFFISSATIPFYGFVKLLRGYLTPNSPHTHPL